MHGRFGWTRCLAPLFLLLLGCSSAKEEETGGPASPAAWLWGLTTDDPMVDTAAQVEALRSLPLRPLLRVVFDPPVGGSPTASEYLPSVTDLAATADVLGLPVDSFEMASMDLPTIQARISEYLTTLGSLVPVWEIGNEINGDWLGTGVVPKIEAMFDAVEAVGKSTALTFYYENPPTKDHDVIPWVDANIPTGHRMRAGLDYVLISYYEDQNGNHELTQAELDTLFGALATRFPNAKLGFGEFGWGAPSQPTDGSIRANLIRKFHGYRVPSVPRFVGGGFYWHFRQTMVPTSEPDWSVMNDIMIRFP